MKLGLVEMFVCLFLCFVSMKLGLVEMFVSFFLCFFYMFVMSDVCVNDGRDAIAGAPRGV